MLQILVVSAIDLESITMTEHRTLGSWNGDTHCFDWRVVYQLALFETDPTKIQERVVDAQIAILKRAYKLLSLPLCREHQELNDALRFLRLLQDESSPSAECEAA
jgi:hypothetical protein